MCMAVMFLLCISTRVLTWSIHQTCPRDFATLHDLTFLELDTTSTQKVHNYT